MFVNFSTHNTSKMADGYHPMKRKDAAHAHTLSPKNTLACAHFYRTDDTYIGDNV